jgi:hypothetical protein
MSPAYLNDTYEWLYNISMAIVHVRAAGSHMHNRHRNVAKRAACLADSLNTVSCGSSVGCLHTEVAEKSQNEETGE